MTDTSKEVVENVVFGLRPMNGSNEMDAGVAMIKALEAERDSLRTQLATALRAIALDTTTPTCDNTREGE